MDGIAVPWRWRRHATGGTERYEGGATDNCPGTRSLPRGGSSALSWHLTEHPAQAYRPGTRRGTPDGKRRACVSASRPRRLPKFLALVWGKWYWVRMSTHQNRAQCERRSMSVRVQQDKWGKQNITVDRHWPDASRF